MAYQAYLYAADPEKVKTAFGSKDQELLEKVKQNEVYLAHDRQISVFKHLMIDIFMHYEGIENSPKKSFGIFNKKPVKGYGLSPRYSETYGFALESLCDYFGEALQDPEEIYGFGKHWDLADKILTEKNSPLHINQMTVPGDLFDIPKIKKFPVISSFDTDALRKWDEVLQSVDALQNNSEEQEIKLLQLFHKHVKRCLELNVHMIYFLY